MKTLLLFLFSCSIIACSHTRKFVYQNFKPNVPPELLHCDCTRDTLPSPFGFIPYGSTHFIGGAVVQCRGKSPDYLLLERKDSSWYKPYYAKHLFISLHYGYAYLCFDKKEWERLSYQNGDTSHVSKRVATHDCNSSL